jgi:radical SAM superfamily enzyme YgiQ (UPF0313 family)
VVHHNPEKSFIDLNELSPPSWHLLDMKRYVCDFALGGHNFGRYLPLHSGRGCPYRCAFCFNTVLKTKKWRPLTPENMLNEVKLLKDGHGIDYVKFVDENFFLDRSRVEKFCNSLIEERIGIKWHATCRASYFNRNHVNTELLTLAKRSGCAVISMGIESGSQKTLDAIKKEIRVEDAVRAVEMCKNHRIIPICSFMIGIPGESGDDMLKTMQLIRRLKGIYNKTVIIGPQVFRPYPGCELYDKIRHLLNEPKSLRGWTDRDALSELFSSRNLPWVKDPGYLDSLSFYMMMSESSSSGLVQKAVKFPLKKAADFRIKHAFFGLQIDKMAYTSAKRLFYGLKVSLRKPRK